MASMTARKMNRRKFLTEMARTACGVSLLALGVGLYARQAEALPPEFIRPPGALPEEEFLSACIRCGICVRDCPYDILMLAKLGDDNPATGTPYFIARTGPCEMCEDIPCIQNCPTNALDHSLDDIEKARMGLAVLIDQEACIAFQGLRCEVCYNVCPVKGKALTLEYQPNKRSGRHALFIPVVHSDYCTGCGLCEKACILDREAIKVLPIRLAKGKLGAHYRLGWKFKEKAGGSLVTPDRPHQFNLPEGVEYDYESGRIYLKGHAGDAPAAKVPGGSAGKGPGQGGVSAKDILNRGIQEAK
jgi:ferredoxin-type protein NapG